MKPRIALKNTLKSGSIALALALLLTTICHAQHNVIYWNGDSTNLQTLASSSYDVVIVDFVTPDQNCDLSWGGTTPNGGLPSDIGTSIQTLQSANKTVLVSFGGSDVQSGQYASCASNVGGLAGQLDNIVFSNGFNGVDIDFEDTNAFLSSSDPSYSGYDGVQFLVQLTTDLYDNTVSAGGRNVITHAPQSPYWYPAGNPGAEGFNWGYTGGPYQSIEQSTIAYDPYPAPMIWWYNNQFYDNPVNDQDDPTKVMSYEQIAGVIGGGAGRLLMGVGLDNSIEGSIISPQDMVQNVIGPLQNFSSASGSSFGGVMAWDYDDDLNDWGGAWGSTAGQALGIAPGVSSAETAHAGLSAHVRPGTHAGRPSAHAGPSRRPHGLVTKTPTP